MTQGTSSAPAAATDRVRLRAFARHPALSAAVFIAVPTLLTALALLSVSASGRRALDADLDAHLVKVVAALRPALEPSVRPASLDGLGRSVAVPFELRDEHGDPLFRSPDFPALGEHAEYDAEEAVHDKVRFTTLDTLTPPMRLATAIVGTGAGTLVAVQVVAAMEAPFLRPWPAGLWLLGGEALLLGGLAWVGRRVARPAVLPARELAGRLRASAAAAPPERLTAGPGEEGLSELIPAMNDVLDRLDRSKSAAEEFVTGAARELQAPLAAIAAAAETCARASAGGAGRQPAEEIGEEARRAAALVRDLRLLALADAGRLITRPQLLDLHGLVAECADIARAIAEAKSVRVETRLAGHPVVNACPTHLRRMVLDLAQHAIRASEPFSPVEIRLEADRREAALTVWNGQDLPPLPPPQVYDRFSLPSSGRRDPLGNGLELAVAQAIAGAHGGRLEVGSRPGQGTTFTATLPLAGGETRHGAAGIEG